MTPIVSATLLRTQSDARLLALARQGYERAFEAIVERYRKPLLRYCRRILPEARAEDAVQQTFLKAWGAIGDGVEVQDLKPWLYRISRNSALDAAKRAGYDYDELNDSVSVVPAPEADVERRAVIRETLAGVAALPSNQREALLRTAVAGESRSDVARDMGLTDGAVRQLVHRARATLRAAATVVTPIPLVTWAAAFGASGEPVTQRVGEIVGGAGSAGGVGMLLKAGTVVVAAGVLAVGPGTTLRQVTGAKDDHNAAADTPSSAPAVNHPGVGITAVDEAGGPADAVNGRGRHQSGHSGKRHPGDSASGPARGGSGSGRDRGGRQGDGSGGGSGDHHGSGGSVGEGSGSSGIGSGFGDGFGSGSGSDGGSGSGSGALDGGSGDSGSGSGSGSGDSSGSGSGSGSGEGGVVTTTGDGGVDTTTGDAGVVITTGTGEHH